MNEIINSNMFRNPQILIEEKTLILDDLSTDLNNSIKHLFEIKFRDFKILSEKINTLSPLSILSRGYSIVWKLPENIIIKDSKKVCINDNLKIKLFKGELESKIIKITE
jgi:exodeoxyribonuclease VII large subunit